MGKILHSRIGGEIMKYYTILLDYHHQEILFDVVWGMPLEEDETLAVFKRGNRWNIIDIASGLTICNRVVKTKKEILEWYTEQRNTNSLCERIKSARSGKTYKERVDAMQEHKILYTGDRCTYIDVKDSVILDLIIYSPTKDKWLVKDEWHQFEVSSDRLIKVSEV